MDDNDILFYLGLFGATFLTIALTVLLTSGW